MGCVDGPNQGKCRDMVHVREARVPEDVVAVAGLDTSFLAERELDIQPDGLGFSVAMRDLPVPRRKVYPVEAAPGGIVAVDGDDVIGYAEVGYVEWNRRAVLGHFYVANGRRRGGTGTALLAEAVRRAKGTGAWCLWLETQNVNEPAIGFYLRRGFRICGLDTAFYDPDELPGEAAVFLAMDLRDDSP